MIKRGRGGALIFSNTHPVAGMGAEAGNLPGLMDEDAEVGDAALDGAWQG